MAFGKRGAGQGPVAPQPADDQHDTRPAGPINVRTRVTNAGGLDARFIGLAVGVVVLSAGGAIAAPVVFDMFGQPVRPIEQVIAGLDRDQAKTALHYEAFPDADGRALMSSLQRNFPQDHDRLLTMLAAKAASGGDREDLMTELTRWSVEFVPANMSAIGRTGSDGFDEVLNIASGALNIVEAETGCTAEKIGQYATNPANLTKTWEYGSEGYRFGMRANATLVDLAAKGRNRPPAPTDLRREDEEALTTAFIGMMMDEQVLSLIQSSYDVHGAGDFDAAERRINNIDMCKLGKSIIYKLRRMPFGTKDRLFAIGMEGKDKLPADLMKDLMNTRGIPGINAPPSGFPIHLMEGPTIEEMQTW